MNIGNRVGAVGSYLWAGLVLGAWASWAAERGVTAEGWAYRPGQVLVQRRAEVGVAEWAKLHERHRTRPVRELPGRRGLELVGLPEGMSVPEAVRAFAASGSVEYAEPDYLLRAWNTPNDPLVSSGGQWHLLNTGRAGGVAGVDIDATEGWEIQREAGEVVVAVVDSGIRPTHEDLAANLWTNPGEIAGNGVDDDRNGYVDDVHGIDASTNRGEPWDDVGHGTHVAGLIGAVGNNGKGGAGVAWKVRLMACRFIDGSGEGPTSEAIECLDYARRQGARVVNCSWGGPATSSALRSAFQRLRDAGILVTAAAGNEGHDNDETPQYPASYVFDNLVTVAASTASDGLADFSNFGVKGVHVAAPGVALQSTWHTSDRAYAYESGTSMAAPVVAGVMALMRARFPQETTADLVKRLLATVDPLPALTGKCVSGGRVNLRRALADTLLPDFTASVWQGSPPLTVRFTSTTRGAVVRQSWDFGDGETSEEASPTHVFRAQGNYSVELRVEGVEGSTASKTRTVSVVGNYEASLTGYSWIDPAAHTALTLTDNGVSAATKMPFSFRFYGQSYDTIYVGANGLLGFRADGMATTSNADVPTSSLPNGVICPYWDNLNPAAGGRVSVGTVGFAPGRSTVVSWVNVPLSFGGSRMSFQAILEERTGRIVFQYLQVQPQSLRGGGRGATVGVENESGLLGARYLYNGSPVLLANSTAVAFVPKFAAGLEVAPSTGFAASGRTGGPFTPETMDLTLKNAGTVEVPWRVGQGATWLEVSPASGRLRAGSSAMVRVSLATEAAVLGPGRYTAALDFVNEANGLGNTRRNFTLTVEGGEGFLQLSPETGFTSRGVEGGPFTPASQVYTLVNTGDGSLEWGAGVTQPWLALTRSGGVLAAGETTTVVVSVAAAGAELGTGTYADVLTVTNATNGRGSGARAVTLQVSPKDPLVMSVRLGGGEGVVLDLQGPAGKTVVVEASEDLRSWMPVGTNLLSTDTGMFSMPVVPVDARRFYRGGVVGEGS